MIKTLFINTILTLIIVFSGCFYGTPIIAQTPHTEHTLRLTAPQNQQKANIEAMNWLVGFWSGEGFGATCEETWNPSIANAMMGMFQMIQKDKTLIYEFVQIIEENGSLILKLKHFNADFSSWEEKGETVDFPLIKIEGQTAWFDGLTYQRKGEELKSVCSYQTKRWDCGRRGIDF